MAPVAPAPRLAAVTSTPPATSEPDPLLGRVLNGRYRVEGMVARGGMAMVYRGVDTRLERTVAIKVMHASFAADPAFVERFGREARAAARLTSPHVVHVHDQGTDLGVTYLVMEYVPGHTVRDVLRTHGPLPPSQALAVLDPVLEALAAAHRAGYIHRDIKPENVLISEDGRVKVTDFGLARAIASTESATSGILLGTVAYLSPEQVEEGPTDARSDVYGAGILLYELVTGQVPYSAAGPMQVAYKHVHEQVPAPSSIRSGIPEDVDELVHRATRRDPAERFPDAVAFLAATRQVRSTLPPPGPWAPTPTDTLVVATHDPVDAMAGAALGAVALTHSGAGSPDAPQQPAASFAGMAPGPDEQITEISHQTSPDDGGRRRRRRGRRAAKWLAAIAVLSAVALLVLVFGPFLRVKVPDVVGKTPAEATALLATVNLALDSTAEAFSEDVAKGHIMETSPGPNRSARNGATIQATVSKGPERYTVPELKNLTVEEAQIALGAANMVLGAQTPGHDDKIKNGHIISSDPKSGASAKRDTAVAVVVSQGPAPVVLPVLVGASGEASEQTLKDLGLKVDTESKYSESVDKGLVISMDPTGGTTVHRGDTVELVVSKGPPMVTVPNVVGKSKDAAISAIQSAGLVASVHYPVGFAVLNLVQTQNPKGGQQIAKGSTVTIHVV